MGSIDHFLICSCSLYWNLRQEKQPPLGRKRLSHFGVSNSSDFLARPKGLPWIANNLQPKLSYLTRGMNSIYFPRWTLLRLNFSQGWRLQGYPVLKLQKLTLLQFSHGIIKKSCSSSPRSFRPVLKSVDSNHAPFSFLTLLLPTFY